MSSNTRYLDLDEIELPESDIKIKYKGTEYPMRTLTVEAFIKHQKNDAERQRLEAKGEVTDEDVASSVELIHNSILEFFPGLPVGEMEMSRLFKIFVWLSEISSEINTIGAASVEGADNAEGQTEGNE